MACKTLNPSNQSAIDVVGVGVTAVDDVLVVADYPDPDHKTEVLNRRQVCGGLTATALVAASRLGATTAYAGSLGTDERSRFVLDSLVKAGVDVSAASSDPSASPVHSIVIVDQRTGTRTILFDPSGYQGPAQLPLELLRRTRVLLVDHLGLDRSVAAARLARVEGVPVVADIEGSLDDPQLAELLEVVDHLVVGESVAISLTGTSRAGEALDALWESEFEAVVVTSGEAGSWQRDKNTGSHHTQAFPVSARDTTGCGDIFHGAYATALARDLPLLERVRFASATAALAAAHGAGGQAAAPTAAAVEKLLAHAIP
jgi:sulfofructose kinase